MADNIAISDIKIGTRFRKDAGDLRPLVDSIKHHGLLHPIVVSDDNQLICGKRRISAYMQLGRKEIEVNLVSPTDLREAEADENNETKEVNKGYNQVRRFQRIKEAEISVKTNLKSLSASGDMKTLGENIANISIDLIFRDPPYNEASLSLYEDLAKLADRVLKPGGRLVTYA